MLRVLYFFAVFGLLFAEDSMDSIKAFTEPKSARIVSVKNEGKSQIIEVSFDDSAKMIKGESGFILRDLGSYEAIVSSVEVLDSKEGSASCIVKPFVELEQKFLPEPRLQPKEGDLVLFRQFNDKAFIIAPNEATYRKIRDSYGYINFINSDLLMGFLNQRGKYDPTEKNLPIACSQYGAGLLFIAGSKEVAVIDCQNMSRLTKYAMDMDKSEPQSPFYTRVNFEGGGSLTYSLSSKKSRQYYEYYDGFIDKLQKSPKK